MLSIFLFGSPQILLDGQAIQLPRRKSRALLFYLAGHAQPLTREHLLAFFWPDLPRPAAQGTLRTTLHGMRKVLGDALQVEESEVGLAPEVEVDVRTFEAALSPISTDLPALAQALDLYRGEFLADFFLPDAAAFEYWVTVERERLRRLAMRGLEALAGLYESQSDLPSALACLDRALAFDPLQEDLQRESIRLLYLAGDRPAAIRRYDTLRKLLDEEMGVPPMLETRQLYDAILKDELDGRESEPGPGKVGSGGAGRVFPRARSGTQAGPGAGGAAAPLPFTGRKAELRTLSELIAGRRLALIEGEAGIGKTRLAQEFIRQSGALPLAGAAHELEGMLPYQPVVEALRSLLARPEWPALRARLNLPAVWWVEVARLLPELAGDAGRAGRGTGARPEAFPRPEIPTAGESRLWEGIQRFLEALARETISGQRPVIFFIDDLQWADASTLSLLGYLVRQGQGGVFYLATTRPALPRSPLVSFIQSLVRLDRLRRAPLSRLSPEEILEIARQISPLYSYPLADWLRRTSEGNPYILAEMVRYGREQGFLRPDGQANLSNLPETPVVPATIFSLIQARLARLSDPARRVLDAAVAMGREFDFEVVAHVSGLSETAALDALDELRRAGLVSPLNQESAAGSFLYAFDHSLTLEVAFQEVGEARHRLLHRRVAEAMESLSPHRLDSAAGLIAWHFTEGRASERAAPYALRAGQWAAGLAAWKEAIEFFEQALAAGSLPRQEILLSLGEAQFNAGRLPQATETLHMALREAQRDPQQANRIRLSLAQTLLPQARFAEIIDLMEAVLASGDEELAVQAEYTWGTALSLEGADLEGAAAHLHRAEGLCAAQANPAHLAQIKFELGSVAAQQGDLPRATGLYRQALAAAQQAAEGSAPGDSIHNLLVLAHNNLAYHLHLMAQTEAAEYARTGMALAQDKGILNMQPYLLSTLGEIALAGGDPDGAEQKFEEGLALAERLAMPERVAGLTANLGLVAHERGQNDLAIHRLSTALAQADAMGTRHLAAQVRLWLAPLLPPQEARRRLAEARQIAEASGRGRLLEEARRLEMEIARA